MKVAAALFLAELYVASPEMYGGDGDAEPGGYPLERQPLTT